MGLLYSFEITSCQIGLKVSQLLNIFFVAAPLPAPAVLRPSCVGDPPSQEEVKYLTRIARDVTFDVAEGTC